MGPFRPQMATFACFALGICLNRHQSSSAMIQGLRTAIYHVSDLPKAKAWYTRVIEKEPYFDQPFYVGFSVGGFELVLVPDGASGPGGAVAYWGVTNADAVLKHLQELGAI